METVMTAIMNADAKELAMIVDLVKERQQVLRSQMVMSLAPGDRVRLCGNLRPKYLLGRTVTIKSVGTKSVRADTRDDLAFVAPRYAQANLKIPITCVEKVS